MSCCSVTVDLVASYTSSGAATAWPVKCVPCHVQLMTEECHAHLCNYVIHLTKVCEDGQCKCACSDQRSDTCMCQNNQCVVS